MFRIHRSAAHVQRRAINSVNIQQIKSHASAHDIADRIHRTHFMEMNFRQRNTVNLCFCLAQALKHCGRVLFGAIGERRLSDQLENILEMPVMFRFAPIDIELRGRDTQPGGLLNPKTRPRPKAFQRAYKSCTVYAGVNQCAHRHVSADAREGVEITDLHAISWGSRSPDGPCRNWSIRSDKLVSAILISTTRAPEDFAICTRPAAG